MTALDAPSPPPPPPPLAVQAPPAPPRPPKAPTSVPSVIAFILIALTAFGYMTAKTLVPVFDGSSFAKQVDTIAIVFGILGFLSIVPIAAGIVAIWTHPRAVLLIAAYTYLASGFVGMAITRFRRDRHSADLKPQAPPALPARPAR